MKRLEKIQKIGFWCVIFASFITMLWSLAVNFDDVPASEVSFLVGILVMEVWFANQFSQPLHNLKEVWQTIMIVATMVSVLTAVSMFFTGCFIVAEWCLAVMFTACFVAILLDVFCKNFTSAVKWLVISVDILVGILAVFSFLFLCTDAECLEEIFQVLMGFSIFSLMFSFFRGLVIRE